MNKYHKAWEQFRVHNKLTYAQMNHLCKVSQGVRYALNRSAGLAL